MEHCCSQSDINDALHRLVSSLSGERSVNSPIVTLAHGILSSTRQCANHSSKHSSNMRRIERTHDNYTRITVDGLQKELMTLKDSWMTETIVNELVAALSKIAVDKKTKQTPLNTIKLPLPIFTGHSEPAQQTDNTATISMSSIRRDSEEVMLLRECLYALQGMNGKHIQLHGKQMTVTSFTFHQGTHSRLGSGTLTALQHCAETGWLFTRVQHYVNHASGGFCTMALVQALRQKIHDYHVIVAAMDYDLQQQASTLTLRHILLNLDTSTRILRILAMLTDGLVELQGGQLLTGLYQHSLHGDTRHASLVHTLLLATSIPWFEALFVWTTQGVLLDPHDEFCIQQNESIQDDGYMWANKYSVDMSKVPLGIMSPTLVEPALLVGKGIHFIRSNLLDLEWRMEFTTNDEDDLDQNELMTRLGYVVGSSTALRAWLNKAADQVNSHILESLRAELKQHLYALKQFLLLGQGDFFSDLMTGLHAEFENKVGIVGIYNYVLTGIVESSIKSTNAVELPAFVLNRLRVELDRDASDDTQHMFGIPKDGEYNDERTGWDIFMLKYDAPDRLAAILGEEALTKYRQVFSFLFGMKRVEFMLTLTWRQSTSLQHALQTFAQYNGINATSNEDFAFALSLLRKISMTRQSMTHFVTNLKSYLFFEVLDGSWKLLLYQIEQARSLDDVIGAHDRYLDDIIHKSLLSRSNETGVTLSIQLDNLLALSLLFCQFQENVFNQALEAADRSAEKRRMAEGRMKDGEWGFESEQEVADENAFFGLVDKARFDEVNAIYDEFHAGTLELMGELETAINGNGIVNMEVPGSTSTRDQSPLPRTTKEYVETNHDSLRFLMFQLDYSSFYNTQSS